jgi:hypothetical protein
VAFAPLVAASAWFNSLLKIAAPEEAAEKLPNWRLGFEGAGFQARPDYVLNDLRHG